MKMLVCGGRGYANEVFVFNCLDRIASVLRIDTVIEGAAIGADRLGREWATKHRIPVETYPADWYRYGKSAGPIRNRQMLTEGHPDLVVAFPSPVSRGTWDMIGAARTAGVKVLVMPEDLDEVDALGEGVFQ